MGVSNNFARSELQRQSKVADTGRYVALENCHLRSLNSISGIKSNNCAKHGPFSFFNMCHLDEDVLRLEISVSNWWLHPLAFVRSEFAWLTIFLRTRLLKRCCSSVKKLKTNREGAPILWPSSDISWSGPELNDYRNISSYSCFLVMIWSETCTERTLFLWKSQDNHTYNIFLFKLCLWLLIHDCNEEPGQRGRCSWGSRKDFRGRGNLWPARIPPGDDFSD